MSGKTKIYLTIFVLAVALPMILSSCDFLLGGWMDSLGCCDAFAFIGVPLLIMKVINKNM